MKHDSKIRKCLFNGPQWYWYPYNHLGVYPSISNTVLITRKRLGEYQVTLAVPSEMYLVMKQQGITEITQFYLNDGVFGMVTDKGDIDLWVYKSFPKWGIKQ